MNLLIGASLLALAKSIYYRIIWHYEPHLWLVGFPTTMRSAVVLICSCVVDVWMWLPTLLECQFRECADEIVYFILFYFIFCMRLIRLHYQENCVSPSLKCHTTRLHPLIVGGASLSSAPFTGYRVDMKDISVYLWTFTFIRGFLKEVYRENSFPFYG